MKDREREKKREKEREGRSQGTKKYSSPVAEKILSFKDKTGTAWNKFGCGRGCKFKKNNLNSSALNCALPASVLFPVAQA
jgi:hypothetical protein